MIKTVSMSAELIFKKNISEKKDVSGIDKVRENLNNYKASCHKLLQHIIA